MRDTLTPAIEAQLKRIGKKRVGRIVSAIESDCAACEFVIKKMGFYRGIIALAGLEDKGLIQIKRT